MDVVEGQSNVLRDFMMYGGPWPLQASLGPPLPLWHWFSDLNVGIPAQIVVVPKHQLEGTENFGMLSPAVSMEMGIAQTHSKLEAFISRQALGFHHLI